MDHRLVPGLLLICACTALPAEETAPAPTPAPAPAAETAPAAPAATPAAPAPAAPPPAPVEDDLALPPAPALVAAGTVPAASGPSTDADRTVSDLRLALRRRNYAQAEAYLAALPTGTAGYKDLVKMIATLRSEQQTAHAALGAALAARRCGELAQAVGRTATLPDLAAATAQAQAYIAVVEGIYDRAFARINTAIAAKDAATARRWLDRIPAEAALLPPTTAVKRAAAAQAIAGLADVTTPR